MVQIGDNKHNTITLLLICCNRLFMCNYVIMIPKENWDLRSFSVERFKSYISQKANNHKFVISSPLYSIDTMWWKVHTNSDFKNALLWRYLWNSYKMTHHKFVIVDMYFKYLTTKRWIHTFGKKRNQFGG